MGKIVHTGDSAATPKSTFDHLEGMFWKSQQSGPSPHVDHQEVVELNIGFVQTYLHFPSFSFFLPVDYSLNSCFSYR